MRRVGLLAALASAPACSDFVATPGGVSAIEIETPVPAAVEVDQTRPLHGRAVDARGDSLPVALVWYALDSTLAVDSTAGLVTGRFPGSGRVIARAADLYSPAITFQVLLKVDTLIRVTDEEVDVGADEEASVPLVVLAATGEELDPVGGRPVTFVITAPVFANPEDRTVELTNGELSLTATTLTAVGTAEVAVRRRPGHPAPASATVTAHLLRPGGAPVPGSGLTFTVRFVNP